VQFTKPGCQHRGPGGGGGGFLHGGLQGFGFGPSRHGGQAQLCTLQYLKQKSPHVQVLHEPQPQLVHVAVVQFATEAAAAAKGTAACSSATARSILGWRGQGGRGPPLSVTSTSSYAGKAAPAAARPSGLRAVRRQRQ
jgi:hypothetical protein